MTFGMSVGTAVDIAVAEHFAVRNSVGRNFDRFAGTAVVAVDRIAGTAVGIVPKLAVAVESQSDTLFDRFVGIEVRIAAAAGLGRTVGKTARRRVGIAVAAEQAGDSCIVVVVVVAVVDRNRKAVRPECRSRTVAVVVADNHRIVEVHEEYC